MQLTALSLALTRIGLGGFGVGSSLNLDFTSGNRTLDPRITFSRASNATVTGPDGTLQYAPHNLLTFSEQFDNAAWVKTRSAVVANAETAPDGTTTADKLADDGLSTGVGYTGQAVTFLAGTTYYASVFVKAAEFTSCTAYLTDPSGITTGTTSSFNLATGVVISGAQCGISTVGNGWFRIWVFGTPSAGSGTFRILLPSDTATGNGFYIWGAQLNVGSLQPYYPTTVKNLLGFTQEFDNAAWTKSNSFVQTNLLTWSEQFDNAAWLKVRSSITQNAATAPDGTATADKLVIDTTAATNHNTGQNITIVSGATYTLSVYVKAAEFSQINLRFSAQFPAGNTTFDLSTETKTNFGTVVDSSIDPVGGGWYRCTFTQTANASGTATAQVFLAQGGSITIATANGADGVLLWGAQLVQGSTPGDYQRTEGTARAVMYPAPDGSRTADKLVEDTANSTHLLFINQSVVTGTPYVASVYAKAAGRSIFRLQSFNAAGDAENAVFDLDAGVVVSESGGPSAKIEDAGDGWFRCSITLNNNTDTGSTLSVWLFQNASTSTYTGDGTSGIYIWGAQLSDSASLDPYVYNPGAAPTAAAYYGPRFDYDPVTLAPRGLLIEEQRTNSIRNNTMQGAVAGTPGTAPTNWAVSTAAGITRQLIGTGIENGVSYIEYRFSGTATGSSDTQFEFSNLVAAASGQAWASSAYVKLQAGSLANVTVTQILTENNSSGGFLAASTQNITPTSAGLNAQRFSLIRTLNNAATAFVTTSLRVTSAGAIDITLRIGMPQLELGAFATSVIPTSGAAATRAADVAVMTGANFSNWYRQDEGTLFVDYYERAFGATHQMLYVSSGASSERIAIQANSSNVLDAQIVSGGTDTFGGNTPTLSEGSYKIALAYAANNAGVSSNGSTVTTDTSVTLPVGVSQINLGATLNTQFLNSTIKRLAYFPRRLSNAELQGITS